MNWVGGTGCDCTGACGGMYQGFDCAWRFAAGVATSPAIITTFDSLRVIAFAVSSLLSADRCNRHLLVHSAPPLWRLSRCVWIRRLRLPGVRRRHRCYPLRLCVCRGRIGRSRDRRLLYRWLRRHWLRLTPTRLLHGPGLLLGISRLPISLRRHRRRTPLRRVAVRRSGGSRRWGALRSRIDGHCRCRCCRCYWCCCRNAC